MRRTFPHRPRLLRILAPAATALAILAAAGCGGGVQEDPILRLSSAEALEEGKRLLEEERYARARPYLIHAFEVEPNSAGGREALLLAADTYYLQGGESNWIQAEAKYRDFINRFPTSEQAAYAQFQIGNSLAKRMEKPNRDVSSTEKALGAYEELLRLYPTSDYAEAAEAQIREVRQSLAEHEFLVGRFNYRYKNPFGAISRFDYLLENFPDYEERDKALFFLGKALDLSPRPKDRERAPEVFHRLREEHPESPYVSEIPDAYPPGGGDRTAAVDGEGDEG